MFAASQWALVLLPDLVLQLAQGLRARVLPELGSHAGRAVAGPGAGGDVTFTIDEVAEQALEDLLEQLDGSRLAYYSEDRGLVADPNDTHVLIVDPIDGTRPAMAGLEAACVAIALAPLGDGAPTMADLEIGCVGESKAGDWYLAQRGEGVRSSRSVVLSANSDVGGMFWAYGFRGRPARPTVEVLGDLIDASSVGGGTFELDSQAFAMTRLVTGQLDAVVEVGSRLIDDVAGMREEFERVGEGEVLNNSPYDLAAPWLCLREAGGIVSDGWGTPLDHHRLLGSGHEYQMSSISASNRELHEALVRAIDAGIGRVQRLRG
jgi:myo-inositol-1(or 4)-monophosphatase